MAGPTPEQVLAVNALLQQAMHNIETANQAAAQVSIPVSVQNSNIGLNLAQLTRALTLEGTATIAGNLDQVLVRTAAGNVVLQVQQQMDRELLNMLPSRVTVQLRPGPEGLVATLVVGNKAAVQAEKPVNSLASGTALSGNQTLTAQIPKINQINQALVLPSSLFSSHTPEEFLAQLNNQVQGRTLPAETGPAPNSAQNFVSSILQKLGINAEAPPVKPAAQLPNVIPQNIPAPTDKPIPVPGAPLPNVPVNVSTPALPNTPSLPSQVIIPSATVVLAPNTHPNAPQVPLPLPQQGFPIPGSPLPALALAPQTTVIKVIAVIPPQTQPSTSTASSSSTPAVPVTTTPDDDDTQIAIVRGNTPSGQPVLSVGDKFVAVQGARNWPVGMQLKVLIGPAAGLITENFDQDVRSFPALRQLLESMASLSPALYNDVARLKMPQASPQQLPGALLFLLSALNKGAPEWLGSEVSDKLKEFGKEQLLRTVSEQWRAQMNQEAEGPGGQWRGMTIPLFHDERMHNVRFYVYDPPDQRGRNAKRDPNLARRFLIDFNLTRLGSVQLDGLVHKKRLDLVVRTDRALESALREELVANFRRTLEEVRFMGDLRFATNRTGWVDIKDKFQNSVATRI
jgi:hypothetical protein